MQIGAHALAQSSVGALTPVPKWWPNDGADYCQMNCATRLIDKSTGLARATNSTLDNIWAPLNLLAPNWRVLPVQPKGGAGCAAARCRRCGANLSLVSVAPARDNWRRQSGGRSDVRGCPTPTRAI